MEVAKKMGFQVLEFNGEGNFAISVGGAPWEVLKEYIKNQEKPS